MGAKNNWRKSRQRDLQQKAGQFYENLLAPILHCELSPRGEPEYADLRSHDLGVRVEVKARGDSNGLVLRVKQILFYQSEPPFPLDHSLYALVPYRSRRWIKVGERRPRGLSKKTTMVSLFRGLKTDREFTRCWAENVTVVYLLDIRIISTLMRKSGTIMGYFPDRPDESVVIINRSSLEKMFVDEDFSKTLRSLRLKPVDWVKSVYPIRTLTTLQDDVPLEDRWAYSEFSLVTVLPKELHARFAQKMTESASTETV